MQSFGWVRPNEKLADEDGSAWPHGAFVYRYFDPHVCSHSCVFCVTAVPTDAQKSDALLHTAFQQARAHSNRGACPLGGFIALALTRRALPCARRLDVDTNAMPSEWRQLFDALEVETTDLHDPQSRAIVAQMVQQMGDAGDMPEYFQNFTALYAREDERVNRCVCVGERV